MIPEGILVHGRYRVSREVGHGGMGAVYEAIDTRLQCKVALKQSLVRGDLPDRAFLHEAQLLAGLRHSTLPLVTDFFVEGDGQFLVMQFIPGEDLATTLRRRQEPFPLHEVLRWCRFLFNALEYLHGHHPPIVHRDIKPGNLKLTDRGELVLLDFGLAKGGAAESSETSARSVFGYSLRYAPPEQIEGRPTDARSDLYALGATLYHLLTATVPPNALERSTAQWNRQPDPLRSPRSVNPAIPEAVGRAVMRAMALDPAGRFGSASEMRSALDALPDENGDRARAPDAIRAEEATPRVAEPVTQARRIDAAVPDRADVGKPIDLFVQVRFHDSPRLGLEDWPVAHAPERIEQASEPLRLSFPVDPGTGALRAARVVLKVAAPDFVIEGTPDRLVEVPPDDYSRRIGFLLTATRPGVCRINVEVYGQDALFLGAIPVETDVGGEPTMQPAWRVANLLLQVLAANRPQGVATGMPPVDMQDILAAIAPTQPAQAPPPRAASPEAGGAFSPVLRSGERAGQRAEEPPADEVTAVGDSAPAGLPARPQPLGASRHRIRWMQIAAPAAVVVLVATAGVMYLTGGGTPRQIAAALPPAGERVPDAASPPMTEKTAAARHAPPVAAAPPGTQRRQTAEAAGPTVAPGRDLRRYGLAGVTLDVPRIESLSGRTRVHLAFVNRSGAAVPIVIDYANTYLMDDSRNRFVVVDDPAGTVRDGVFRAVIPAGRTVEHWLAVSSEPLPASGRPLPADFLVVRVPAHRIGPHTLTSLVVKLSHP